MSTWQIDILRAFCTLEILNSLCPVSWSLRQFFLISHWWWYILRFPSLKRVDGELCVFISFPFVSLEVPPPARGHVPLYPFTSPGFRFSHLPWGSMWSLFWCKLCGEDPPVCSSPQWVVSPSPLTKQSAHPSLPTLPGNAIVSHTKISFGSVPRLFSPWLGSAHSCLNYYVDTSCYSAIKV